VRANNLKNLSNGSISHETRRHTKRREIGKFEHPVVSEESDAPLDRAVEASEAIEEFCNQFATSGHSFDPCIGLLFGRGLCSLNAH
jgi:hypothetical protein